MENFKFTRGKHKGKTFRDVRINHTEYFVFLITQPAGNVVHHFKFIKYCMGYLQLDAKMIKKI